MRRRSTLGSRRKNEDDAELGQALDAMTAPELRSVVREVLADLDQDRRAKIIDALLARTSKETTGWKPSRPSARIVDAAIAFADAARQVGYAEPDDVSEHLRQGARAFMAGDHAGARAVFGSLLPLIAAGDVDLGQHELVSDVLSVDGHACVAQYVASVYSTTPPADRADAVYRSIAEVEGVSSLMNPIQDMESVLAGALPELGAFLPRWIKRLERHRLAKDEWETAQERWLREAIFRLDGADGLERLARRTKRPRACLAWGDALAGQGQWAEAFRAYRTAVPWVRTSHWRGELLDAVAVAARVIGRRDLPRHLEAAWRRAPTLTRLLRWLAAGGSGSPAMLVSARRALVRCPKTAGRQLGLIRVLMGDITGAALQLTRAPGFGWSDADHPGHVVFGLFVLLLSDGRDPGTRTTLIANLESAARDPLDLIPDENMSNRPRQETPSIAQLIGSIHPTIQVGTADRAAMLDGMRAAAEKRTEAILSHSRRRHYGHAAMLAATCVALAPKAVEHDFRAWLAGLRETHSRRHAFRDELSKALHNLGVRSI